MKKKLLSVLLVVCMLLTMLPTMASAAEVANCTDANCTHLAAIGTTHYDTVQEAIEDASTTKMEIDVLQDIMTPEGKGVDYRVAWVKDNQNIILDLNGKKIISSYGTYTISVDDGSGNHSTTATLTIIDSVDGGAVDNDDDYSTTIRNYGTLNIGSANDVNLNNFTISRQQAVALTNSAIKNEEESTLNIYRGTTIGGHERSIQNFGSLNVYGGTFEEKVEAWTWTDPNGNGADQPKSFDSAINITDGTFNDFVGLRTCNDQKDMAKFGTNIADLTLDGGTFNGELGTAGIGTITNEAEQFTVKKGTFTDVANAVKYATDGATITIAEGADVDELALEVSKNLTLDLNGNTLKSVTVTGSANVTVTDTNTDNPGSVTDGITNTGTGTVTNSFTITFNVNGGLNTKMTSADGKVEFPTVDTIKHWEFLGWSKTKDDTVNLVDTENYVATGNEVLYAVWNKSVFELTLTNGTDTKTYKVSPDTYSYDLPNFDNTDTQNFGGWSDGVNTWPSGAYTVDHDTTLTAVWTDKPTYVAPSAPTTYTVTVAETTNGTVTTDVDTAARGETVTVTVTPNAGYALETLVVTDRNGTELALTANEDGTYSFAMPRGNAAVTATFVSTTAPTGDGFYDVADDAWYAPAVEFVSENGIMNGYTNNTFRPNNLLTRAELAQILYNLEGRPEVTATESAFTDVTGDWYFPAVVWAAENGVVNGFTDGTFRPGNAVTREQMAVMLCRYAVAKGLPVDAAQPGDLTKFTDGDTVSEWAVTEVSLAVGVGMLSGYTDGSLQPTDGVKRSEAAQMFLNIAALLGLAE